MGIFRSLAGMITVQLTSADPSGSLASAANMGIPVFSLQNIDTLTVQFQIPRHHYRQLKKLADRRGETLKTTEKWGLYWNAAQLLHRPLLMVGLILMLILLFFVPKHIFFVRVEGNAAIPAREIIDAAEACGIRFGASRREVRSEKVKNELLSCLPQLQWAGINTYGCTAVISVSERSVPAEDNGNKEICSIAASRDGVILSCTVTSGNGLCTAGQAVKEGQILISPYTDCGLCITVSSAEGEIMALTNRALTVISPSNMHIRTSHQAESAKYSLLIGKNRINFYKGSGISDATCGKMYSKYVLTLPGGFELPIALIKETTENYSHAAGDISEEAANVLLKEFSEGYLLRQMIAGSITDRSETIAHSGGVYCLTGVYACTEMIGRRQQAKIGELHEAN